MVIVKFRTRYKHTQQEGVPLSRILEDYTNALLSELNEQLSNYHSIQEHASRNRIIEFAKRKCKDLDLLQLFVKGAFLIRKVELMKFKGEDCTTGCAQIVEMADFLAMLFEDMKTSFIPPPNFNMALQTFMSPSKLLPVTQIIGSEAQKTDISVVDFDIVHRMMRIHLLCENLESYEISNGILQIKSKFFRFELALCGDFFNPHWLLYSVKSKMNSKIVEEHLLRKLVTIRAIQGFVKFYECRMQARLLFEALQSKTGFYQNFTGHLNNIEIQGCVTGSVFNCKVFVEGAVKQLVNPDIHTIEAMTSNNLQPGANCEGDSNNKKSFRFRPDLFESKYTHVLDGMFFSLNRKNNVCRFGRIAPTRKLLCSEMILEIEEDISGCFGADVRPGNNTSMISPEKFTHFIDQNRVYLKILYIIRDLRICCRVKRSISAAFFYLDTNYTLFTLDEATGTKKHVISGTEQSEEVMTLNLVNKIRMLKLHRDLPKAVRILEHNPGIFTKLQTDHAEIKIDSGRIETSHNGLNMDCEALDNLNDAFEYALNFLIFYTHCLIPTFFTTKTIYFRFTHFIQEIVEITVRDGSFVIKGPKLLKITKLAPTFKPDDAKNFVVLHKFFLADRFIFLKSVFKSRDLSSNSNEIILNENTRITLKHEGIIFAGTDLDTDRKITEILSTERDISAFLKKYKYSI